MEKLMIDLMSRYGYLAIFLLIFVENLFPPIPSEVILLFGGFMTTYAGLSTPLVVVAATLGSIAGAEVLYYIGSRLGLDGVKRFFQGNLGRRLGLKRDDLTRTNRWFRERGYLAVFLCRFVPLMRSLISIPAGIAFMNRKMFFILTLIGSAIWNTVLVLIGRFAGSNWEKYNKEISIISDYVLIIGGVLLGTFILYKIFRRKKYHNPEDNMEKDGTDEEPKAHLDADGQEESKDNSLRNDVEENGNQVP